MHRLPGGLYKQMSLSTSRQRITGTMPKSDERKKRLELQTIKEVNFTAMQQPKCEEKYRVQKMVTQRSEQMKEHAIGRDEDEITLRRKGLETPRGHENFKHKSRWLSLRKKI